MSDATTVARGGRLARAVPWLVGAIVAAVHLATSNRDLAFYDSGELAMVAVQAGLSHPIGQPLHTLLGWLLTHLPGPSSRPLAALVALSAVPAGLAVVPVVRLAEVLARGAGRFDAREAGVASGLAAAVALHPSAWEGATRVEVYPLAIALALFATARLGSDLASGGPSRRGALAAGALLGLAASANAFVAILAAVGWLPIVLRAVARRRLSPAALAALVAGGVLGLTPYLYVPWAAGRAGAFAWGGGADPAQLAAYFGGADYAENLGGVSLATFARQVGAWLGWATRAGHLPLLLGGVSLGVVAARRARWDLALAPMLAAAAGVWLIARYRVFHPDIADYVNYQALGLLWSAAGLGAALAPAAVSPGGRNPARARAAAVVTAVCLAGLALVSPPALGARTRARDHVARELAEATLRDAPPGAVLVFAGDHVLWPVWYLQTVEGLRPDVVAVSWGLAGSSWWWRWMTGRHPWLEGLALRGPGGIPGRLARLRALGPGRAWRVESLPLARRLGLPVCGVALWPRVGETPCGHDGADAASAQLATWRETLDDGAPTTDEVLALVAEQRGDALWATGAPAEAFRAYRAGLGADARPPELAAAVEAAGAPPVDVGAAPWEAARPLGDPRRLSFRLGQLLMTAGRGDAAAPLVVGAASRGLPEAAALVQAVGGRGAP